MHIFQVQRNSVNRRVMAKFFGEEWNYIQKKYEENCKMESDIKNHLPRLKSFGEECEHITEMGIREGLSTSALLVSKPKKYIGYDIIEWPFMKKPLVLSCKKHIDLQFIKADTRKIKIEETDLLMIDTHHCYQQLKEELRLHSDKSKKYIIMHDTVTWAHKSQKLRIGKGRDAWSSGRHKIKPPFPKKGLWDALQEFLDGDGCKWKIKEHFEDSNGLTILERK
tara:strand:- start:443 stop:1111 length:669 start_codon:yes stop_codon:yes gene_type:complete